MGGRAHEGYSRVLPSYTFPFGLWKIRELPDSTAYPTYSILPARVFIHGRQNR